MKMALKGVKKTEDHKKAIAEGQRARWARLKEIRYEYDEFTFLDPMTAVVERLNERANEGWVKDEMLVKNGIFIIYKQGG